MRSPGFAIGMWLAAAWCGSLAGALVAGETNVLFIIAAPGRPGGRVCDRVVEYVDLYPTLVDLCGLPPRGDLEGRSLRPLIENPSAPWDHPAFSIGARDGRPAWLAVRTGRFRYFEYADPQTPPELYDIQADPSEWKNAAADPGAATELRALKALAAEHRRKFWW